MGLEVGLGGSGTAGASPSASRMLQSRPSSSSSSASTSAIVGGVGPAGEGMCLEEEGSGRRGKGEPRQTSAAGDLALQVSVGRRWVHACGVLRLEMCGSSSLEEGFSKWED